ncbi:MAG: hypothetical protein ACI9FJ_003055 [Alteromonadaceae bacterium]|jgi:hypothetical protein
MSQQNQTPAQTLNEIINSLDYITSTLPEVADDDNRAHLSSSQAVGLRQILLGLKASSEACFGQLPKTAQ